jgi:hypothetical protein
VDPAARRRAVLDVLHRVRPSGSRLLLILVVAASCSLVAAPYQVKVPSGIVPRTDPATIERVVASHIASRPNVYPSGSTHRIISMEWVPQSDDFRTPDGGGFGFNKPAWAVTIDGPVRGLPGEPSPGRLNMIMVDDASAEVWGWTP